MNKQQEKALERLKAILDNIVANGDMEMILEELYQDAYDEGYDSGHAEGYNDGHRDGMREAKSGVGN